MTHLYCRTEQAILLLVARTGPTGLMLLPDGRSQPPGRLFTPKPLLPIQEQLLAMAKDILSNQVGDHFTVEQNYSDRVILRRDLPEDHPQASATLYLISCELASHSASEAWPSFPEVLRTLPRNRDRLPYLRAFQVLAGGLQLNTKAIDARELARYFPEDASD